MSNLPSQLDRGLSLATCICKPPFPSSLQRIRNILQYTRKEARRPAREYESDEPPGFWQPAAWLTCCAVLQMLPHIGGRREGDRKRGEHKMELRGVLTPWVLDRLCHVLEDAQQGQLQVSLLSTMLSSKATLTVVGSQVLQALLI